MRVYLGWVSSLYCIVQVFTATTAAKQRLGICVTGQLSRMELWSKIHNIVVPNMHAFDIDVHFVLDDERNEAVNERIHLGMPLVRLNVTEITDRVAKYSPNCQTFVDFYAQAEEPTVVERYKHDQFKLPRNQIELRTQRAVIHVRIFASWSRCLKSFMRIPSIKHDVLLRVREDLYTAVPMQILPEMWNNSVGVLNACN